MTPVIEVVGPWLHNKGDQLMLAAVAQRLAGRGRLASTGTMGLSRLPAEPAVLQVLEPAGLGVVQQARRTGGPRRAAGTLARTALPMVPAGVLARTGRVASTRLAGVVDVSGFAYGDQWSLPRTRRRAARYVGLAAAGVPVVLLPQALGPFRDPAVRAAAQQLLCSAALVCPRDDISAEHARELGVPEERLHQAPDITHLLHAPPPPSPEDWAERVCVVPSARILDRTDDAVSGGYADYLAEVIRQVQGSGHEPWLVLHEANDAALLDAVQEALGCSLPILDEDGLRTKSVLGACRAVVGSRFHALVSALSQGTPTLGMSWSHKYEALFDDYDARQFLVHPVPGRPENAASLARLLDDGVTGGLREQLRGAAARQTGEVEKAWLRAEAILGLTR